MRYHKHIQARVFEILEVAEMDDFASRSVDLTLQTLILINVSLVILETIDGIVHDFGSLFHLVDMICVTGFTIEYALRIWTCTHSDRYEDSLRGRLRYARSPVAVVDLLAILPFYVMMLFPAHLAIFQAMRLLRLLRLFKLGRYSSSFKMFGRVIMSRKEELLVTMFAMLLMVVFASSTLYYVEHGVQPEKFSSIPASMWWGVATLTTVGYGDIYPITPIGKFCGALIAIVGIAMFAIPAGLLASGFAEHLGPGNYSRHCPNCGSLRIQPGDETERASSDPTVVPAQVASVEPAQAQLAEPVQVASAEPAQAQLAEPVQVASAEQAQAQPAEPVQAAEPAHPVGSA